jgi:hypothetical protein
MEEIFFVKTRDGFILTSADTETVFFVVKNVGGNPKLKNLGKIPVTILTFTDRKTEELISNRETLKKRIEILLRLGL